MKVIFTNDKSTKNTIRFSAPPGIVSGSIYVHKSKFDGDPPKEISVEVEIEAVSA